MAQNTQQMWDLKADAFYSEQMNYHTDMPQNIIGILRKRFLLPCPKLLDVGGGSGRYAVPLAAFADSVTVTDISSKMLAHARDYAAKNGIAKEVVDCVRLDWENADLQALGWLGRFDIVFASMSQAVKTREGLGNMIRASKGWCCIAQYIDSTDNVEREIVSRTHTDLSGSPHHDRKFVDWLFHELWTGGMNPWVEYLEEELNQTLTVREATLRYERRFGGIMRNQEIPLESILAPMSHENRIKISGKTTMACVLWKVA